MKNLILFAAGVLGTFFAFPQVTDTGDEVGVGISSPLQKLHVNSPNSTIQLRLERGGSGFTDLGADNNGLHFWAGGYDGFNNTDLFIGNTGNVGIGITSPSEKLNVFRPTAGVIARFASSASSGISGVRLQGKDGTNTQYLDVAFDATTDTYGFGSGASSSQLPISSGFSQADMVVSGGNVGIGITSPSEKLNVFRPTAGVIARFASSANSGISGVRLQGKNGSSTEYLDIAFEAATNTYGFGSGSNSGQLPIGSGFGQADIVFSNGDVGIGTVSPSERLNVFDSNSGVLARFASSSQGGISGIRLQGKTGDGSDTRYMDIAYDANTDSYGFGSGSYSGVLPISTDFSQADLVVASNGNVGIGIIVPDEKLSVDGTIQSEEIRVEIVNGPDYVFEEDYDLRSLEEIEKFIKYEKHLPEVPSAKEMEENGVELGEMNMLLLKKIEELTLYNIQQQKLIQDLNLRMEKLEKNENK